MNDRVLAAERHDEVAVLSVLAPRLDASAAPRFRAEATEGTGNAMRVVLDLALVEFVDSTGLGALIGLMKSVAPTGVFVLAGAGRQVMKLLSATKLDRVFNIEPDLSHALSRARR
jgi:anti-sigma B factor antagonist